MGQDEGDGVTVVNVGPRGAALFALGIALVAAVVFAARAALRSDVGPDAVAGVPSAVQVSAEGWPVPWDSVRPVVADGNDDPRSEGTRHMAALLAVASARADPATSFFAARRAQLLDEATPEPDPTQRMVQLFGHAAALAEAGRLDEAVDVYGGMQRDLADQGVGLDREVMRVVTSMLAAALLRLGEERNCVVNHNPDSCVLPIAGDGVHQDKTPSQRAIPHLSNLARSDPSDLTSRWLLNVAHMTVGDYPSAVQDDLLLPPELFTSDVEFPRFYDVAHHHGLDVMGLSGGAVMEDFDGDGRLDVMASSWGPDDQLRLFLNRGSGRFEDATEAAGLIGITGGLNLVQADYDNDGHVDVFVLRGAWQGEMGLQPNSLLRNRGGGVFDDVTAAAGVLSFHPTQTAGWADYDGDGWLDLFVANESTPGQADHPCELYRNNGDGTFTNVAAELGVDLVGYFKGVAWGDIDNDGRPDLFLSRLMGANVLLRNRGPASDGRWSFVDETDVAGVAEPFIAFPTWFFDYDNDGWLDLFVSGYGNLDYADEPWGISGGNSGGDVAADLLGLPTSAERARLYRNLGNGRFEDVSEAAGVHKVLHAMGANYGDFNADGYLDMYLGTGEPDYRGLVPNRAFLNDGEGSFNDVTFAGGFGHLQKGHGVAFGDIDGDGDEDIYVTIGGAYQGDWYMNALLDNPTRSAGGGSPGPRYLTLRLSGSEANRLAIGARVKIVVRTAEGDSREIHRLVGSGGSFGGSSLQLEVGLGAAAAIEAVEIVWPGSGTVDRLEGVPLNSVVRVHEGTGRWEVVD